jgi:hypothetical protein
LPGLPNSGILAGVSIPNRNPQTEVEKTMNGRQKQALGILATFATAGVIAAVAAKALTAARAKKRGGLPEQWDAVDLYIEESFPASDAPSYTPITHIGGTR